jgi:hypothetical protein
MTDAVFPETIVLIGETPTTEVRAPVEAAWKMTPPVPSATIVYPAGLVDEEMATFFPDVVVVTEIGKVPCNCDTETELLRVRNSLVSIQTSVGSTGRISSLNSS